MVDYSIRGLAQTHLRKALCTDDVNVISASAPEPDLTGQYHRIQSAMTSFGPVTIGWRTGGYDVMCAGKIVAKCSVARRSD